MSDATVIPVPLVGFFEPTEISDATTADRCADGSRGATGRNRPQTALLYIPYIVGSTKQALCRVFDAKSAGKSPYLSAGGVDIPATNRSKF